MDAVVALSLLPLREASNYICLYHMHEKYLNNLAQRWGEGLIPDLYEYFRQPWACAVFHDHFSDFMEEVREYLQKEPIKVCRFPWVVEQLICMVAMPVHAHSQQIRDYFKSLLRTYELKLRTQTEPGLHPIHINQGFKVDFTEKDGEGGKRRNGVQCHFERVL